jgi:Holliday junction DNA helicase RuvA
MFRSLTQVSGIGPKTAVQILSSMPLRDLTRAIMEGDVTALSRAQGVGKKTAQRIALELKDKVSQAAVSATVPSENYPAPALSPDAVSEAIEAMIALGYSSTEARNAISQIKDQTDKPEELIRLALRAMAGI